MKEKGEYSNYFQEQYDFKMNIEYIENATEVINNIYSLCNNGDLFVEIIQYPLKKIFQLIKYILNVNI